MALRTLEKPRDLLERILETPDLARAVQSLEPAVLHQVVRRCGLEDSGPILALATTEQLVRLFDDDLWRAERPGEEERFDTDRFGQWLEVLAEAGGEIAARRIVEMDFDFVTAALGRHVLVLDAHEMALERLAAELLEESPALEEGLERAETALDDADSFEVGGFRVVARRGESWDALWAVLTSLAAAHPAFFGKLMTRCAFHSAEYIADNGGLYDVLTSDEQVNDDVAAERESRRERAGYVTPPLAAGFLALARQPMGTEPPRPDHVTVGYFRTMERRARELAKEPGPTLRNSGQLLATLGEAGVLPRPETPLLPSGTAEEGDRHRRVRERLLESREQDAAAPARRTEELAYLTNVLLAGCSFRSRRFRTVEAAEAALAACNLGLENWPRCWAPAADLVSAFRVGWSVAHEQVCLHAARRLVDLVADLGCDDGDVGDRLRTLGRRMASQVKAGTPWRAREDLDVIAILDPPSWATLQGLVDECPTLPRTEPRRAGPPLRVTNEFEFISENRQVLRAREFVESLPERLAG